MFQLVNFNETDTSFSFIDEELELFKKFMEKHLKIYKTSEEFKKRFRIFRANLKKIAFLQSYEQGTAKYGPTEFADLSSKYLRIIWFIICTYHLVFFSANENMSLKS